MEHNPGGSGGGLERLHFPPLNSIQFPSCFWKMFFDDVFLFFGYFLQWCKYMYNVHIYLHVHVPLKLGSRLMSNFLLCKSTYIFERNMFSSSRYSLWFMYINIVLVVCCAHTLIHSYINFDRWWWWLQKFFIWNKSINTVINPRDYGNIFVTITTTARVVSDQSDIPFQFLSGTKKQETFGGKKMRLVHYCTVHSPMFLKNVKQTLICKNIY